MTIDNIKSLYIRNLIFDAITNLLPTMGRDFTVSIKFEDNDHVQIDIFALTKMGEIIKEELMKHLQTTLTELINAANRSNQNGKGTRTSEQGTRPAVESGTEARTGT